MKYPNNLRKIRLSQSNKDLRSGNKIAELLGITPQYYYNLETGRDGKRLNIDHINKLTKIFNVTSDEILDDQVIVNIPSGEQKKPKDLLKILEQEQNLTMNGEILSPEDLEVIKSALEQGYHLAKRLNKRK